MLRTFVLATAITCSVVLALRPTHVGVVYLPWMYRSPPVTVISTPCYSCGSGNGPSAHELAALVRLAGDEHLVAVDGVVARVSLEQALAGHHNHGAAFDFLITGPIGLRHIVLVLT